LDRSKHRHSAHKDWLIDEDMQLVQGAMQYTAADGPTATETTETARGAVEGADARRANNTGTGTSHSSVPTGTPAVWSCKTNAAQLHAGQSVVNKGR
jgi:hypothetical protein